MNSKKLVLEEYNSNFNYKINQSNISISFNRVAFIFFVSVFIFMTFTLKIIFLTGKDLPKKKIFLNNSDFRSSIIDRNGNIIAKTVITKNIGIDPKEVIDEDKLLINLQLIFPNKNLQF